MDNMLMVKPMINLVEFLTKVVILPADRAPSAQNLALVQKAGKRRGKRGGFLGPIINQAIVPFSLVAMQNRYGRKTGGKTRRHRR